MSLPNISNIELSLSGMVKGITCAIPKIKVSQNEVPAGTKKLYLILEDTNFGNFPHGLHQIDFTGSDLFLEDKFEIIPLNPPGDVSHQYRLTVRALDDNHTVLGIGTTIQQFP